MFILIIDILCKKRLFSKELLDLLFLVLVNNICVIKNFI